MEKFCFGADIGGTTVKIGLFKADAGLVDHWEIPTRKEDGGERILPDITASINEGMVRHGITAQDIIGIGADVPGPVNDDGSVPHTANIGWGYKAVKAEMEELTGLPCHVGNDANVAALGEMWKGAAAGYKNVLMITLGTGVGGGVILNGGILNGAHGAAGEVGHLHVSDGLDLKCGCGNKGCLEQFVSATGIARMAREILEDEPDAPSVMRGTDPTAKDVFDAVKAGDILAMRTADNFGKILGNALAGMVTVIDPEVIVIGGGVSKAGPVLLEYIRKYYVPRAFRSMKDIPLVLAALGNDAGIYGCAKMTLAGARDA